MNSLKLQKRISLGAFGLVAVLLLASVSIHAGDKIVVGDDKGKAAAPNQEINKGGGDLFKSWNKVEQPGFDPTLLGIPMIPSIPRMSADEEKKLRFQRAEKKNFLLLTPGELQRKDDEENSAGGRKYSLKGFEKEEKNPDYTFHGIDKDDKRQPGEKRVAGQSLSKEEQAADAKQAQQQREREDAEDDSRKESRTFSLFGTKDGQGAHTSSELSFNKLFGPTDADATLARTPSKSEFSLRDILGSGPTRTKEQQAKMDDFNKMLNTPLQPGPLGMANPLSLSQPIGSAPAFSKPPDAPSKPPGNDLFGGPSALPNRLAPPGLPTLGSGAQGFSSPSPFSPQMPAAQDTSKSWLRSSMQEPPRRKF